MTGLRSISTLLAVGAVAALSACGNGNPSASSGGGGGAAVGTAAATLSGTPAVVVNATATLKFDPASNTAKVGDVVEFKNTGNVPHNVTFADPAGALTSGTMQQNDTWEVKFSTAGTYSFQCTFHPGMQGTLTVS